MIPGFSHIRTMYKYCPFVRLYSLNSILLIESNALAIIPISRRISFIVNSFVYIFVADASKISYIKFNLGLLYLQQKNEKRSSKMKYIFYVCAIKMDFYVF